MSANPFITTQAVETWDTWFRWRERGQLRDLTVEDTWRRVAAALAAGTRAVRPGYVRRLYDAMRDWQLLLDERLLASAGTGAPSWTAADLGAALNLAAFVRAALLPHAKLDLAALEEVAALSVFALDDAAHRVDAGRTSHSLQIGLIGVGDALQSLGLAYDSDAARTHVAAAAAALARGCLAGAIAIARDRGGAAVPDGAWFDLAERRGQPHELTAAAARYGVAYHRLTAIAPQQRLACFANGIADALDPAAELACVQPLCGSGAAGAALRARATPVRQRPSDLPSVEAQLRLRAAAQPWIDAPIVYPVLCETAPSAATEHAWRELALGLGLLPPPWRLAVADCRSGSATRPAAAVV